MMSVFSRNASRFLRMTITVIAVLTIAQWPAVGAADEPGVRVSDRTKGDRAAVARPFTLSNSTPVASGVGSPTRFNFPYDGESPFRPTSKMWGQAAARRPSAIRKALKISVRKFWIAPRLLKAAGVLLSEGRIQ